MMNWQPIETAPADGQCLLWVDTDDGGEVMKLYRDGDGSWLYEGEPTYCAGAYINPTHWMPLPPPPAADRELLEAAGRKRERHGMNKSPEHQAWVGMRQRCCNPNKREWPHYGGRGINVCERWQASFLAFLEDVGTRPTDKHSLDRIDVDGNYEPGNVRWATQQEQIDNTRIVRIIAIGNKAQSISAWEREMGLSKGQVRAREASGWSLEDAILTPSVKGQKRVMNVQRDYSTYKRDGHGRYEAS
jgi:hypothetical protein